MNTYHNLVALNKIVSQILRGQTLWSDEEMGVIKELHGICQFKKANPTMTVGGFKLDAFTKDGINVIGFSEIVVTTTGNSLTINYILGDKVTKTFML